MRKYLDDLDSKGTWNMTNASDKRIDIWKKEQAIYGFDERDTWNLDHTMLELLYERIKMFVEIVNIEDYQTKVIVDDKETAFSAVVNELIELCEKVIKNNTSFAIDFEEQNKLERRIWSLWAQTFDYFWW